MKSHNNKLDFSFTDSSDIFNLCTNSVFKNDDDLITSDYYNIDEANFEFQKTPEGIVLIHINSVSLCANYNKIVIMLAKLKPNPSIIFVSETRVQDAKLQKQLNEITIEGYSDPVYDNSKTDAGGTAIYVSNQLTFKKLDIKFDQDDCEACFVEIECGTSTNNPIFGRLIQASS